MHGTKRPWRMRLPPYRRWPGNWPASAEFRADLDIMYNDRTTSAAALALHDGTLDPVESIEIAIERSRASPGVFISFIEGARDDAVKSARRRHRGAALGRLDGVIFAVKDMIDVAGSVTTAGSVTRLDTPAASEDAAVIAAMRAAGMIPVGKTNLSEFAFSGLGLNPHFGTPTADFQRAAPRAPGGSSSGSAIAVQRGLVTAAIGTDTAGSIRVPAAFNALVGYRPSTGRYDMRGVHPLAVTLDTVGPLARSVEDCVLLDSAMRGCADIGQYKEPIELKYVRFVVDSSVLEDASLEPDVARNLRRVSMRLRRCGAIVDERPVEAFACARALIATHGWLGAAEAWSWLREIAEGPRGDRIDRRVRERLRAARAMDRQAERHIRVLRVELMQRLRQELGNAVLITPTVKHVAPELAPLEGDDRWFAAVNLETLSLTMPGSLLDMPGIAMPSGLDRQGLPTSVLFSAPQGHDDPLLHICLAVESELLAHPIQ